MSDQTKVIIYGLVAFLVCCVVSYFAGRVKGREIGWKAGYSDGFEAGYNTPHPADTLVVRDTLLVDHPVEVVKWRERVELLPVRDTIRIADSVFVEVPIESKIYADSTYRAQVSGWHPSLDWIEVYQRTQIVTQYVEKRSKGWHIGVGASVGAAAVFNTKDPPVVGPGVALGLTISYLP